MNGTVSSAKASVACTGATESPVIIVRAYPNPLHDDYLPAEVAPGQTVLDIVGRADLPAICIVDGRVIECEEWSTVVPRGTLDIRRIPAGGDTARIIGTIAVLALAVWAGPVLAGSLFAGSMVSAGFIAFTGAAITAGIGMAGTLLLNHLVPPATAGGGAIPETQQLGWLTSQSNRIGAFAPVPVLYGRMQYYPPVPMTALPYTEIVGDEQYLRVLYVLGYGPLSINGISTADGLMTSSDSPSAAAGIKIGGTSISQFEDLEWEIGEASELTLYTRSVVEQSVAVSIPQTGVKITGVWVADGGTTTRTTDSDTAEISLDLYAPALFSLNTDNGKIRGATVDFKVEARKVSSSPIGAWTTLLASWPTYNEDRDPVRIGKRFKLPSVGTWEVRLTRVRTLLGKADESYTEFTWTVLRSIKQPGIPFDVANTVLMALRIRATDQLGGRLESLSVEATRILPVWDTTVSPHAWVDTPTRNPAWAYVDVLTGVATRNALAKSRVDVATLKSWADWCDDEGLYCDAVIDAQGTVFDRARDVASAGLASWHISDDGSISIVRDIVADAVLLVSPRNSAEYAHEYVYPDLPHCVRVQFMDPDRWEPTERLVYDDDHDPTSSPHDTPTRFEQLQTFGVTDADQAWKIGRYHLAQLTLRPETYSWMQDIAHLVAGRGQCVELSHDVILVGLKWGRIKTIAVDKMTATVDEYLPMAEGDGAFDGGAFEGFDPDSFDLDQSSYALRIQRQDGTIITRTITTVAPGTTSITFESAATDVEPGDHFIFGVSGSEVIKAKITRIEPQGNFQARIRAVPAADDIFDAWDGDIPEFDPVITEPIGQDKVLPPVPTFVSLLSESVPTGDGKPMARLAAVFTIEPGLYGIQVEARYRVSANVVAEGDYAGAIAEYAIADIPEATNELEFNGPGPWRFGGIVPSSSGRILIESAIEFGVQYEVQLRSVRSILVSPWTDSLFVAPALSNPPAPVGFSAAGSTEGVRVTWQFPENPAALDYYQLWHSRSPEFDAAEVIYQGRNTAFDYANSEPDDEHWFWVVAWSWGVASATVGPVSATALPLDWRNLGGDDLEEEVLNSGIVRATAKPEALFTYDGTDYQVQRTEQVLYTYDSAGTRLYKQGSESADADREFPWIDTPIVFYRGNTIIKTFTFRHLCNYGREDATARIGTKIRSVLRTVSGSEPLQNFTVSIGASANRVAWDGESYLTGPEGGGFDSDSFDSDAFDPEAFEPSTPPGHEIYAAACYGGDASQFAIIVTHIPSNTSVSLPVALSAINAVVPFYDYNYGGGGGYK